MDEDPFSGLVIKQGKVVPDHAWRRVDRPEVKIWEIDFRSKYFQPWVTSGGPDDQDVTVIHVFAQEDSIGLDEDTDEVTQIRVPGSWGACMVDGGRYTLRLCVFGPQSEPGIVCTFCLKPLTGVPHQQIVGPDGDINFAHDPDCRPTRQQIRWFRTVRRNRDKPHRCPKCHSVANWRMGVEVRARPIHWPLRLWCAACEVRWWYGKLGDWWGADLLS